MNIDRYSRGLKKRVFQGQHMSLDVMRGSVRPISGRQSGSRILMNGNSGFTYFNVRNTGWK